MQKFVKLVTKTDSKMHKSKTYNKGINNLINRNIQQKVINKELQNLDSYYTCYYTKLILNCIFISNKQVLKIKYYPDRFIEKYKTRLLA